MTPLEQGTEVCSQRGNIVLQNLSVSQSSYRSEHKNNRFIRLNINLPPRAKQLELQSNNAGVLDLNNGPFGIHKSQHYKQRKLRQNTLSALHCKT